MHPPASQTIPQPGHGAGPGDRTALLVIDMQKGLFHGPQSPWRGADILANVNRLIGRARDAGAPVIFLQHSGPPGSPAEPGSPGWELLDELDVAASDRILRKTRTSVFWQTPLDGMLVSAGVRDVVVCGMKTDYCIDTACRVAAELGYRPVLAADAHTTVDAPGLGLAAEAIVGHHNRILGGAFAQVVDTADLRFFWRESCHDDTPV